MKKILDYLFVIPQYILPHHLLSYIIYGLMRIRFCWLKNIQINTFIRLFKVDMEDAQHKKSADFRTFNDFFTRSLNTTARPIAANDECIISPADGSVSQAGAIDDGQIIQAKNHHYSLAALLANDASKKDFQGGTFATIYLSPRDYHRVHMPITGTLRKTIFVKGRLFSVNQTTANHVDGLFTRNERLICLFDTANGPMAVILVGALFVSSMETVWHGVYPAKKWNVIEHFLENKVELKKGDELGRFNMGSTVILLTGKNVTLDITAQQAVKMGEKIANYAIPE